MEDMEDEIGHGGGGKHQKKKGRGGNTSKSIEVTQPRLTHSDPDYPKDVPKNAKFYEKFWSDGLFEVMNQGCLKICWNIASTRTLASRLFVEGKVTSLEPLSLRHLVVGLFDKTKDDGELKDLKDLKTFLEEEGAVLESDCTCPNPLLDMKKKNTRDKSQIPPPVLCTHKGQPKRVFKVKELKVITKVVEEDLILFLNKGQVAISVEYYPEFVKFRGSGIYEGHKEGSLMISYHMLKCVGYGTLNGVHYWKVQNSAGRGWGEDGFGKIIRQTSRKGKPSLIKKIIYPVLLDAYTDE